MKFDKIAGICKKSKSIVLFDQVDSNSQWIGDGYAMYLLENMPYLGEENCYTIFDVTESSRKNWQFRQLEITSVSFDNFTDNEVLIEAFNPWRTIELGLNGNTILPLVVPSGLLFINSQYLAPFNDRQDTLMLYVRKEGSSPQYIAVKIGMILVAVIMPIDIVNKGLVEEMEFLSKNMRKILKQKQSEENLDNSTDGETPLYTIDFDTGEVKE